MSDKDNLLTPFFIQNKATASNPIGKWTVKKPTEPGFYLICQGHIPRADMIEPIQVVSTATKLPRRGWRCYTPEEIAMWHSSFIFAKLTIPTYETVTQS